MSQCECAEIMASDPTRHFRGCPLRAEHPTHEVEENVRQKEKEEFAYAVLKNMGIDISCGSCMSIAFTGVTTYKHTCSRVEAK